MNDPSMRERERGHSRGGENVGRLLWIGAILAASTLLVIAAMYLLFARWSQRHALQTRFASPPSPTLQFQPQHELAAERAQQRARLQGYGWVDRRAGIARIPIGRAMQLWREHHAQLGFGAAVPPAPASASTQASRP